MTKLREPNPQLDAIVDEMIRSGEDPRELLRGGGMMKELFGRLAKRILDAELANHLGYEKNEPRSGSNARNGSSRKTVLTEAGKVELEIPRDRDGSFEPALVEKHQRRLEGFDERVLALYARGMTVREIKSYLEEIYGAEVSPALISRVTDAVVVDMEAWRARPLDAIYPIVYLDGLVVKVRDEGTVQNRTVYVALGVDMGGKKNVLGLWMSSKEGAKFWLHVLTELRNRGVEDIMILCCDGLKGLPEAISAVFPKTTVQTCIVHMIRGSLGVVSYKDRQAVAKDLQPIYKAATEAEAEAALATFGEAWNKRYPSIARSWTAQWSFVTPFLRFGPDIRRAIYTTNAIEALNRQLRRALKPRGHFPNDEAVLKVLYLALERASRNWSMPIANWPLALQQLAIHFDGRIPL